MDNSKGGKSNGTGAFMPVVVSNGTGAFIPMVVSLDNGMSYGVNVQPFRSNFDNFYVNMRDPILPFGRKNGYLGVIGRSNPGGRKVLQSEIPQTLVTTSTFGTSLCQENMHVDERTIFLSFSKGYPISEYEIWCFFTRKFGNFIEGIYYQNLSGRKQPNFARMVARNSLILPFIVNVDDPNIQSMYTINGKYVWAKKYVNYNFPPLQATTSTSTRK